LQILIRRYSAGAGDSNGVYRIRSLEKDELHGHGVCASRFAEMLSLRAPTDQASMLEISLAQSNLK
jgi:hypothetical protein